MQIKRSFANAKQKIATYRPYTVNELRERTSACSSDALVDEICYLLGMDRDSHSPKKIPRAVTPAYLERAALDYLGKYSSSSGNLRRVMMRKVEKRCRLRGEETEPFRAMVDDVVAKALRIGLIDDRAYTEAKVASLRRKGNSGRLIQMKLAAKGLEREDIRDVLDTAQSDETQAARNLARRRRIGPYRVGERREFRDKDIAVLARAGFAFRLAAEIIDEETEPSPI